MLNLLLPFQRFFIPFVLLLLLWAVYRIILRRDRAIGVVLFITLIIIVDAYMNTGIAIPGMAQGTLKYSEIVFIFVFIQKIIRRDLPKGGRVLFFFCIIYFVLLFYAALRGLTVENGMTNYRRVIMPQLITILLTYNLFNKEEDFERVFFYMMFPILLLSLYTFWDVFFDRSLIKSGMLDKSIYWLARKNNRFGSFFLNPNYMGAFTVLIFPTAFIITLHQKGLIKRIFCWGCLILFLFAFIKTQSRGPMIGFGAAMMFFMLIPVRKYSYLKKLGSVLMVMLVLYMFLPGFYTTATKRFSDIETETSEEDISRLSIWKFTYKNIISNYPLFGIGLGEAKYKTVMDEYGVLTYFPRTLDNPHNSYLQIAAMAGCIALIIFLLINFSLFFKSLLFIMRHGKEKIGLILLALISGLTGFYVCLLTDMQMFTINVAPVYWLVFGLACSITNLERRT